MIGSVRKIAFPSLLILAWVGVSSSGLAPATVLPGPGLVLGKLADMAGRGELWTSVGPSLLRVLTGYLFSSLLGLGAGVLMSRSALAEEALGPLALILQTLPSVAWFPLMVLWFGENERTIVLIITFSAFGSVALATSSGVRSIPPLILRAARTLGARGLTLAWRVIFPAALPSILTGLKMGWAFAWRALIAAELILMARAAALGSPVKGVGVLLKAGQDAKDTSQVMAVMVVLIGVGLLVDRLVFSPMETRLRAQWGGR